MEFTITKMFEPRKFSFPSKTTGKPVEKFVCNLETSQGKISYFYYPNKCILKEGDVVDAEIEEKDTEKDGVKYHNVSIKSISKVNGKEVSGSNKIFEMLQRIYEQNKEILDAIRQKEEKVKPPLGPSVIRREIQDFKDAYGTMPEGVKEDALEEPPDDKFIENIPF